MLTVVKEHEKVDEISGERNRVKDAVNDIGKTPLSTSLWADGKFLIEVTIKICPPSGYRLMWYSKLRVAGKELEGHFKVCGFFLKSYTFSVFLQTPKLVNNFSS